MIDRQQVYDAVLAVQQVVESATELGTAPVGTPAIYGVVEVPSGVLHDDGDQADPNRHLTLPVRMRSVVRNANRPVAERAALALAARFEANLLDSSVEIAGDGWVVRRRTLTSTSGSIGEGDVVNVVDEFELWVVPAAVVVPDPGP